LRDTDYISVTYSYDSLAIPGAQWWATCYADSWADDAALFTTALHASFIAVHNELAVFLLSWIEAAGSEEEKAY